MAILVDKAIWRWRGERWAHLATDTDPAELHRFANRLGVPRLAFQGDHYDVPTGLRERAIEMGARPVDGRVLVAALRSSGLRRPGGLPRWELVEENRTRFETPVRAVIDGLDELGAVERMIYRRPAEYGIWVPVERTLSVASLPASEVWRSTREDRRGYELVVNRPSG